MPTAWARTALAACLLAPCACFTLTAGGVGTTRVFPARFGASPALPSVAARIRPRAKAFARPRAIGAVAETETTNAPDNNAFADFSWTRQWYPMAFADVTDRTIPHRLELFGQPFVLWWDQIANKWCAMSDSCPHRAAPLSEGRIDEQGQIECPYHGWCFNGAGACTKIPQAAAKDDAMLARCGGIAYSVQERQGLIWVWGEIGGRVAPDPSTIPTCEALEDPSFCWIDVSRDMPYSADMLLENVLDSSHVPFTHHQTISKRENAVPLPVRLTAALSANGFDGEIPMATLKTSPDARHKKNNLKSPIYADLL